MNNIYDWQTKFAWLPTRVEGKFIWFKEFEEKIYYDPVLVMGRMK